MKYFLLAGETSGDLHGAALVACIREKCPQALIEGVVGPYMRAQGVQEIEPMEQLQVMGFTDVLKALPRLLKIFFKIKRHLLETKPDEVILIDYPGFNLRLTKSLKKAGFQGKIIQYIAPSVWAHGKGRIETLVRYYDALWTIYPFEKKYFDGTGLKVDYLGHPLVQRIREHRYTRPLEGEWVALFPGSRLSEIKRHMPVQLKAAEALKDTHPEVKLGIVCPSKSVEQAVRGFLPASSLVEGKDLFFFPMEERYDLMKGCRVALAKSGSVTLELCLHHTPTIVHYVLSPVNYLIAKYVLRLSLPYYCLVNILKGEGVYPEFIGRSSSQEGVSRALLELYSSKEAQERVKTLCREIEGELCAT